MPSAQSWWLPAQRFHGLAEPSLALRRSSPPHTGIVTDRKEPLSSGRFRVVVTLTPVGLLSERYAAELTQ